MGGFGMVLGGLLEGVGKGIATQGAMDYEARKKEALERLRAQNDRANAEHEHGLSAQLERTKHGNRLIEMDSEYDLKNRNASLQVQRTTKADITKATTESQLQEDREKRLSAFRSNLELREMAAKAGIEASQVSDVVTDGETGAVSVITKGGEARVLRNVIARPKPGAAAGSNDWRSLLDEDGAGAPKAAAAKPEPKSAPAQPPRAKLPERIRQGDKTYTMADVRATAAKHGVSVEDVHRRMRDAGYKLASE